MTERRPFPPSPRRLALARQAGLTSASPLVVGAVACVGAIVALVGLARSAAALVGGWIANACRSADGAGLVDIGAHSLDIGPVGIDGARPVDIGTHSVDIGVAGTDGARSVDIGAHSLDIGVVTLRVIELAAPLLAAAAIAAFVAHLAQTRALWLPRRRIAGAPAVEPARVRRSAIDMLAAAVAGIVAFAWLWLTAPRLGSLFIVADPMRAVGSALASLVVALAIAWIVVGTLDALLRRAEVAHAVAMTVTEKREDDRLAAADPRWRAHRAALAREPSSAVARAAVLLLGDDIAIAIAWDPRRQPVPLRVASGRRARATQLLGLARRYRIPVHRDARLSAALDGEGIVPDAYWARLAEIVVAVQAANTTR